jgi:hypothetical protein
MATVFDLVDKLGRWLMTRNVVLSPEVMSLLLQVTETALPVLVINPVSSDLRFRASSMLCNLSLMTLPNDGSSSSYSLSLDYTLQKLWEACKTGPVGVEGQQCDPKLADLLAQVLTKELHTTNLPFAFVDLLELLLTSQVGVEVTVANALDLLSRSIMETEVGQLSEWKLDCLPLVLKTVNEDVEVGKVKEGALFLLTDFVKKGGAQLGVYAQAITEVYIDLLAAPLKSSVFYSNVLYGLSLWMGKCAEGGFLSNTLITNMAFLCTTVSLQVLQTDRSQQGQGQGQGQGQDQDQNMDQEEVKEDEESPKQDEAEAERSMKTSATYALERVVLYFGDHLPELCQPLYLEIYRQLPIMTAAR